MPAGDPLVVDASPSRDLLIHCSCPEEEVGVVGCSSSNAAWISSAVDSLSAPSLGATQHESCAI